MFATNGDGRTNRRVNLLLAAMWLVTGLLVWLLHADTDLGVILLLGVAIGFTTGVTVGVLVRRWQS